MSAMVQPQSLAEYLGIVDPRPENLRPNPSAVVKLSAKQFCEGIVESSEFRTYILNGITLGDLPPQILLRIMDMAWGKPVERVAFKDETERLEDLTPEGVQDHLLRVQRMLHLVQAAQQRASASETEVDEGVAPSIH